MSNIKKRKIGIGNLITILVLAALAISMIAYAFAGTKKNVDLTQAKLEQYIYTYDSEGRIILADPLVINEISFKTTNHSQLVQVTGTFKEEYKNSVGGFTTFTALITWDSYQMISELSKIDNAGFKIVDFEIPTSFPWLSVLSIVAMIVIAFFVVSSVMKANKGNNQAFDFGKSRAKVSRKSGVTFKDVAGLDEEKEEMIEVVDFLKSPKKYFVFLMLGLFY